MIMTMEVITTVPTVVTDRMISAEADSQTTEATMQAVFPAVITEEEEAAAEVVEDDLDQVKDKEAVIKKVLMGSKISEDSTKDPDRSDLRVVLMEPRLKMKSMKDFPRMDPGSSTSVPSERSKNESPFSNPFT